MRFIITGATGMIGIALIDLLKDNHEIIAIVRPNSSKIVNIPLNDNVTIIECDLSNLNNLNLPQSDVFFHLGWNGTIGNNTRNNVYNQLDNVRYTLDALQLAKKCGCKTFVGAGSQAEYGIKEGSLSPDTSINPQTGYGIAKYTAGKLSKILAKDLGIKHCWTRILSVYGPGDNDSTLISSCINSILENKQFDTTEANQIWDYIYSEDCARAFIKIADKGLDGKVYVIGSGETRYLKEYISLIRDLINPEFKVGFGNREYNPNQVMYLKADISQLIKDTGFEVKTSFEEGIRKTIVWNRNNKSQKI